MCWLFMATCLKSTLWIMPVHSGWFFIYVKTSPSVPYARFWDIAWLIIWVVGNDALSSLLSVEEYFRVSFFSVLLADLHSWQFITARVESQPERENQSKHSYRDYSHFILFSWGEGAVFDCWLKCACASLSQWQCSWCSMDCNFLHSFWK